MGSKKVIVTTTINPPTEALIKFSKMEDWTLVVVGDQKTPLGSYDSLDCIYLSPTDQHNISPKLSTLIGWNCYERKNFGFIFARLLGAEIVATVDDDNIPLGNWGKKIHVNKWTNAILADSSTGDFFDPLTMTGSKAWHRGFPLEHVSSRKLFKTGVSSFVPKVQANLWNGAPDVDAIYRLTEGEHEYAFHNIEPYTTSKYSPFNTQNTIISADVLDKYFLMPGIGRISDIWAAYRLEHKLGTPCVVYDEPTVFQKRNPHDLMKDLREEVFGHLNTMKFVRDGCDYQAFVNDKQLEALHEYERII